MKYILLHILLLLSSSSLLFGQSTISCDIVELAKLTLEINPTVKKGIYNINSAVANVQVQKSEFDYNLVSENEYQNVSKNTLDNDILNSNFDGVYYITRNADYNLGFQKKFRSGLNANLSVGYSLDKSNYKFNSFNEGVDPYFGENASNTTLSITQPLLKGRGKKTTTALENAAKINVENIKKEYSFSVSNEILRLGSAYWNYLTIYKNLEIYTENEKRVKEIKEITEELVKADKKPAGELAQIYAELANEERQTKVAEQNLLVARINLGEVIGLSREDCQKLDLPLNIFPTVDESGFQEGLSEETYIEMAINNREDIKATQKAVESLEIQLYSAKRNLKPQLDLTGKLFCLGQSMGNGFDKFVSTYANNEGRSLGGSVSLVFTFSVNNNSAKGSFTQIESSLTAQQIMNENLERNVNLNVHLALSNLNNSVFVLNKAKESLTYYKEAFNNEEVRFQNGLTTLLNLLIYQERLTNAELVFLQAYQQFATAIIQLRFETGTLIKQDNNEVFFVDYESFYTIPTITNN